MAAQHGIMSVLLCISSGLSAIHLGRKICQINSYDLADGFDLIA